MHRVLAALVVLVLVPGDALAAPKPLAADKHDPPITLDISSAWMVVLTRGTEDYEIKTWFRLFGATSKTDRLKVDVRKGRKVIASGKCSVDWYETKVLEGECTIGGDKNLSAKGPLEVDVLYVDDQQEKEYLVQTLKMDVKHWPGIGKYKTWGYVPDDLLGLAYLRMHTGDASFEHDVTIDFWATKYPGTAASSLRCTVDGNKIPDFEISFDGSQLGPQNEIKHEMVTDKVRKSYTFERISIRPKWLKWGHK